MSDKNQNVQDVFLNKIRKEKQTVTVFLVNGVKLQGVVTWFDNFSMLLRRESHVQLIYKHAISTIMPNGPLSLYDGEEEDASA
ncbi:MAG: RNA chaperone Hfq [Alphaproteobacteria bacterium]|mgnify:CR=1 FL=1|jgi:host factor-I protein|nr:RNA chaperone Hfq [Alphaproteobacteria bacterium]MDP7222689.1 RNA chaperone Hfq [Alphaproteobacteria bacterium]